uniref:Transmembrane protein n=1 Tax=Myoviridae sp. ctsK93 TaxID=2825190 RepID=A0A8S5PJR7_9CAUD|nr:MAG TPA: transmembrane protein [Myoviridae sp. ctsK93]
MACEKAAHFIYTLFAFCFLLIDFFYNVYLFDMFYLFCFFYMCIFSI